MPAEPTRYRIRVSGIVEAGWARELCGMEVVASRDGHSELAGSVTDQSALLGVLRQLRDRKHEVLWLCRDEAGGSVR